MGLEFILGMLAGVVVVIAVFFVAALVNWILARHDRE
jgi:hypothetical protein